MSAEEPLAAAAALAGGLPKLLLAAERLAYVAAPGLHGRRRAGPGEAFWQFRNWQDGDDAAAIDWRRSATGDLLLRREREQEAQTAIALQLHDSAGMGFAGARNLPTKRDRAGLLLLALAVLLVRAGERVALHGITPPLAGASALPRLAAALAGGGSARVEPRLRRVEFGDFLRPAPHFTAPPGGAVVQILDPAECDFPYAGRVLFEGFDGEPPVEASRAQNWAAWYRQRIQAQRAAVAAAAARAGQIALFHRTDAPPAAALAALYQALHRA